MFMRQAALLVAFILVMPNSFATTVPATTSTLPATTAPTSTAPQTTATTTPAVANPAEKSPNSTAPLRQNQTATPLPPTLATLQQKHKQELAIQEQRLSLLEKANQEALAKNQELQLNNDSLAGQVQVLQSERSAQMFLYGAVTFGLGTLFGIILYSVLTARRRRSW